MQKMTDSTDDLVIELFSSLQELSELRRRYDSCVTEGYVNLAKTRYDIGSRSGGMISQLQYPGEMTASVLVECSGGGTSCDNICSPELFQLSHSSLESRDDKTLQTPSSQLRQRKGKEASSSTGTGGTSPTDDIPPPPKRTDQVDPIRWFSALPPLSLRNSQRYFRESLEVIVAMVKVQFRIEELRKRIVDLSRKSATTPTETIRPTIINSN